MSVSAQAPENVGAERDDDGYCVPVDRNLGLMCKDLLRPPPASPMFWVLSGDVDGLEAEDKSLDDFVVGRRLTIRDDENGCLLRPLLRVFLLFV